MTTHPTASNLNHPLQAQLERGQTAQKGTDPDQRDAAVKIRNVSKSFGATSVLDSLTLQLPRGQVSAILGASGSGKTTLLRLIAGFDTIDHGTITIAGRLVDDGRRSLRAQHRGVGYVPQDAALFPHLTVLANIGFGVPRAQRASLTDLVRMVNLAGLEQRYPHQLSGGQQQRVALARALAIRPTVVLLDEPFGSLDAALRDTVRADVARVLAETGTTTILVAHDQDEALSLADHLVLLAAGQVTASGAPRDLYEHPPTPAVAAAIGLTNILEGRIAGRTVHCALGDLTADSHEHSPSSPDGPCLLAVRPEQIQLAAAPAPGAITAHVTRCRYHGHDTLVDIELTPVSGDDTPSARLNARTTGAPTFEPGQTVTVTVSGAAHTWTRKGTEGDRA